jgi:hypothetical protein
MQARVGVVICVHDGWPFLAEAVESILVQDHPVDRVVIVDDASSDEGVRYLARIADPRVLVLHNEQRQGPGAAAQRGVEACDCDLIARLDADDVAEPWRIGAEAAYLESDPAAGLVCASARLIDESGAASGYYQVPRQPAVLEWELMFRNPIVQSTVMFRADVFRDVGGYAALQVAEDYDLWSRFVRSGSRPGSISRAGVRLRKHGSQVSERRRDEMLGTAAGIASANIQGVTGRSPDPRFVRILLGGDAGSAGDVLGAIDLLSDATREFLSHAKTGIGARREISARLLELTRGLAGSSGLERGATKHAFRACIAGAGYSGIVTVRGAKAAARLLAPRLAAGWERLRQTGRS